MIIVIPITDSVRKTNMQHCNEKTSLSDVSLDHCALKSKCEKYDVLFDSFFSEFIEHGYYELVTKVFTLVQKVRSCSAKDWNLSFKSNITEILAGVFATFTIIKSGVIFQHFKEYSEDDDRNVRKVFTESNYGSSNWRGEKHHPWCSCNSALSIRL